MPGFSLESATYLIRKPARFSNWNVHADVLHAGYMRQQTRRCKQRQIFASHRMKDLWVGIGSRISVGNDRDIRRVSSAGDFGSIEQQTPPRVYRETCGSCIAHDLDGLRPYYWYVKAHILIRFCNLHHGQSAAEDRWIRLQRPHDLTGTFDGGIGSFHCFYGHACAFGDDYRLTDVELRQVACESTAVINVFLFRFGGWAPSQHSCFR